MSLHPYLSKYKLQHSGQIKLIKDCIQKYNLPDNIIIDEQLLEFKGFPKSASKRLAILLLCYYREASTNELKKISDQPAAQIRDLRDLGFKFQQSIKGQYLKKTKMDRHQEK